MMRKTVPKKAKSPVRQQALDDGNRKSAITLPKMVIPLAKLRTADMWRNRNSPEIKAICFGIKTIKLRQNAIRVGQTWHERLLKACIQGLHDQAPHCAVYLAFIPGDLLRLFYCDASGILPKRFCAILAEMSERVGVPWALPLRIMDSLPLAYWEAPSTAVALWPYKGNFSFGRIMKPSPLFTDTVELPTNRKITFERSGREYSFENRHFIMLDF